MFKIGTEVKKSLFVTSALVASIFVGVQLAQGANIPLLTGATTQFPADLPDINSTINAINSTGATGINPNTMASFATPRNFLDNGEHLVNQRGTGVITGSTTSGCLGYNPPGATNGYSSDRWCTNTNVTSGAGTSLVTSTNMAGFQNGVGVYRASGSLTQNICSIQEIPASDSRQLQGQTVTFSTYMLALAGLSADNSSAVTMYVIYGTGADQGLGSFTASPAVTPAWTGINSSITGSKTITTSWARYSISGTIPTTANEVGVEICFHPGETTSGGVTDGFAFTGAQLEVGSTPSSYEHRPFGFELQKNQQYMVKISEPTTTSTIMGFAGLQITSANCSGELSFPVTMRTGPTYTNQLSATTFGVIGTHSVSFTSPQALATPFSQTQGVSTVTSASLKFTITAGATTVLGDSCMLVGVNGSGAMYFSADF